KSNLYSFLLKFGHQIIDLLGLRHKIRLAHNALQYDFLTFDHQRQNILGMDNSDNLINIVIINRNPGVTFFGHRFDKIFCRIIDFYCHDLCPRHHDILDDTFVEVEYIFDKLMLRSIDSTTFLTLVQKVLQLFGRMGSFMRLWMYTYQAKQEISETIQHPDSR